MMTEQQVSDWLAEHMPDGPENDYQQGIQDAADFITGASNSDPLSEPRSG
jgi:hypothetical protein